MLLYSLLHLAGYDLPLGELERFRQLESRTPGHPEFGHTQGVEATTGPLGQGVTNAVGMAIAERYQAQRYNRGEHRVVDHFTYALVGDGDLMEGIAAEAASLAGHLGLGKLIVLYDSNDISLDGPTSLAFTEDVGARFESCGWQVLRVEQGDTDLDGIASAIEAARADDARPTLIEVKTTIGYGAPKKAGTSKVHGEEELAGTKRELGWTSKEPFHLPDDAVAHFREAVARGEGARTEWQARFEAWSAAHPDLAAQWSLAQSELLPAGWDEDLPRFDAGGALATREAGGATLNALAERLPWLFGGDADLSESTKTGLKGCGDFDGRATAEPGRNLRYGVREHAMGAIANGIAYHGGCRTYTATFFVFADYMRPAMRLAAMNDLPVTFVFTHDSVATWTSSALRTPTRRSRPGARRFRAPRAPRPWSCRGRSCRRSTAACSPRPLASSAAATSCATPRAIPTSSSWPPARKSLSRSRSPTCSPAVDTPRAWSRCRAGSASRPRRVPIGSPSSGGTSRASRSKPARPWDGSAGPGTAA
jgi:transketolase